MDNILIYDGDCPFCNRIVIYLAKLDCEDKIIFMSNLSHDGYELLTEYQIEDYTKTTIIFMKNRNYFIKSAAIYQYLKTINRKKIFRGILLLTPIFIKNFLYDLIAKNRKKIFKEKCEVPSQQLIHKFRIN